ncbi:hypothetical protein Pelo_1713 [Pelomyxa schiedti]|nr:hypothetical protein Pelo_1713 [Pelomyxa schiedti]
MTGTLTLSTAPTAKKTDHLFEEARFSVPTWCEYCRGFVRNPFGKQGYVCALCGMKIHAGCLADTVRNSPCSASVLVTPPVAFPPEILAASTAGSTAPPDFTSHAAASKYWMTFFKPAVDLIWQLRLSEADAMLSHHGGRHPYPACLYVLSGFWRAVSTEEKATREEALRRVGMPILLPQSFTMVQPQCNGYKQQLLVDGVASAYNWAASAVVTTKKEYSAAELDNMYLNLQAFLIMGMVYFVKALLFYWDRSYASAPFLIRKAWKWLYRAQYLQNFLKQQPGAEAVLLEEVTGDIAFGVGMFHFITTLVPPAFQWFLVLLGFEADLKQSLEDMEVSRHCTCTFSRGAAVLESWIYAILLKDTTKAFGILDEVSSNSPKSPMIHFTEGYQRMLNGELDRARECFQLAIPWFEKEYDFMHKSCFYFAGQTFFLNNDWAKAAGLIEVYLNSSSNLYRCFGSLKLAVCKWMTGEKSLVLPLLESSRKHAKEQYEHDDLAIYMHDKFIANGNKFTPFEEAYFSITNLLDACAFPAALELVERFGASEHVEATHAAWFHYWRLCSFVGLRRTADAETEITTHILPKEQDLQARGPFHYMIIPYSLIELAEMRLQSGNLQEAAVLFTKAASKSGYMFQKYLDYRVKSGRYLIDAHKKGAVSIPTTATTAAATGTTTSSVEATSTTPTPTPKPTTTQPSSGWFSSTASVFKLL